MSLQYRVEVRYLRMACHDKQNHFYRDWMLALWCHQGWVLDICNLREILSVASYSFQIGNLQSRFSASGGTGHKGCYFSVVSGASYYNREVDGFLWVFLKGLILIYGHPFSQ